MGAPPGAPPSAPPPQKPQALPAGEGSISAAINAASVAAAPGPVAPGGPLNENQQKLGRSLLAAGALTTQDLKRNIERSGKQGAALAKALLASGFVSEEELLPALVAKHRVPRINLKTTKIPLETIDLLKEDTARRLRALPLDEIGEILVVVTPDLFNAEALAELRKLTGRPLGLVQCAEEGFDDAVQGYYKRLAESKPVGAAAPASATGSVPVALPGVSPAAAAQAAPAAAPPQAPSIPTPRPGPLAAAPAAAPTGGSPALTVQAVAADASELSGAQPVDGPLPHERRSDWEWAYAGVGPVAAAEVLM